jgi:hypothetical protein
MVVCIHRGQVRVARELIPYPRLVSKMQPTVRSAAISAPGWRCVRPYRAYRWVNGTERYANLGGWRQGSQQC